MAQIKLSLVVLAVATLFLTLSIKAQSIDPSIAEARSFLTRGMLPEAENVLRQFLKDHSESPDAHYLMGYVLFRQAKAVASLTEYTEAAKYRKPSAADLQVVGSDYVVLEDFPDADKWFTKSVEWDPSSVLGWYYLGRTKYNENRFEEAVDAFQHCLKLESKHIKAEDNLGLSYQALGRWEEAQQAYRNAIDWQADSPAKNSGPWIDMGVLFLEMNQPAKAIEYLQKAVEMTPDDFKAHQQLGKAYFNLNDSSKALPELEKAAQLTPDNAPTHYILAQAYRKQGLQEKAKIEFDRYTKLSTIHSASNETDHSKSHN